MFGLSRLPWSVRFVLVWFSGVPLVCSHFFGHSRGQVGVQSAVKRPTSAAANVLSFVLISARRMKRIFYLCLCKCGMKNKIKKKTEINELRAGDLQSPPLSFVIINRCPWFMHKNKVKRIKNKSKNNCFPSMEQTGTGDRGQKSVLNLNQSRAGPEVWEAT